MAICTPGMLAMSFNDRMVAIEFSSKYTDIRKNFNLAIFGKTQKPAFVVMVSISLSSHFYVSHHVIIV